MTKDTLVVDLTDGRALIPLAWYPRLLDGSTAERNSCRLIGRGEGIHWPDLDEDISTEALIAAPLCVNMGETPNRPEFSV